MCAWSYAYHQAYKSDDPRPDNGPITYADQLEKDGKMGPTAQLGTNYYDDTYTMVMHKKWKAKLYYGQVYEIDHLQTNDWGSYDLIVNVFFREKNERLWKLILSDDKWGIDQLALATSKYGGKWRVSLNWYETITKEYCTTEAERKAALLGNDACLDGYFNFYQRRWHDYDWTKGKARKPGEGETNAGKPQPGDGPNDNPPKEPRNPPFNPPAVDDKATGPKPTTKKPKKKKPVFKPISNRDIRIERDAASTEAIQGRMNVRQVVEIHKKFHFLKKSS